ncbi:MAG TPA: efflux transporter outer membrane subunit [Burkholderiales bacterium]|nr:efflux transporter outer membrane subunit [Burkholderiales bacterium]
MLRNSRRTVACAVTALLAACAVGPDYKRPEAPASAAYKEWKVAAPRDDVRRGEWWKIYGDPRLDALMAQIDVSNQTLKQAEANYRQAHAAVAGARAQFFPTVAVSASATRSGRGSGSSTAFVSSTGAVVGGAGGGSVTNQYSLPLDVNWEPDLWGRVRRTVEGAGATAQASAAELEATRLSLLAELATDYFQLRVLDDQQRLLDDTVAAYQKALELTQNQYAAGVAARLDVAQAETQIKTTQAQAIDNGVQRAKLEHAIAVLIGKPPSEFSIAPEKIALTIPVIPPGLPSELLERRPDIAQAEREVAAANAQIGVAKSAYFPDLTLSAAGGFQSSTFADWLTAPNRFWSLGPSLAETLLDFGARRSQVEQARAAYDANVANYRQTVLAGFQEVEDNLTAQRILEQESSVQDEAVKAAEQALQIALNEYKAGTQNYLTVVTAQATALSNERSALTILNGRLAASVTLIKAIGGDWNATKLPED